MLIYYNMVSFEHSNALNELIDCIRKVRASNNNLEDIYYKDHRKTEKHKKYING